MGYMMLGFGADQDDYVLLGFNVYTAPPAGGGGSAGSGRRLALRYRPWKMFR